MLIVRAFQHPTGFFTMADSKKIIARNKAAFHNYIIEDTVEAGIVLTGSEIKSVRAGKVQIRDAYVKPRDGELWLMNAHIADYLPASYQGHEPLRQRKLLLHKREIRDLTLHVRDIGRAIVPLQLYLKDGLAKIEIAKARGKKQHDKRETIAKRESERRMARALGRRR